MANYEPYTVPHRKPVGGLPVARVDPNQQLQKPPPIIGHAHTRTSSSNVFPNPAIINYATSAAPSYPTMAGQTRRTASTATASTVSSAGGGNAGAPHPSYTASVPTAGPGRVPSTVSISLRRSVSSRSGQSIAPSTSYVALMRKQKATVWCDRAQHEDPRLAAQAKAAKARATMEVVGGIAHNRHSTAGSVNSGSMGVRSKIRHHGAPKAVGYSPATLLVGTSGVPMRLSASEVDGEDKSDENDADSGRNLYKRSGSGRSSLASGHRLAAYGGRPPGRLSTSSTPPSVQEDSPGDAAAESTETPVPGGRQLGQGGGDYFVERSKTNGSGSSGEREFGGVGNLEAPVAAAASKDSEKKTADDLTRRGSVDERAMTMRGPRLFVANPDASDSD